MFAVFDYDGFLLAKFETLPEAKDWKRRRVEWRLNQFFYGMTYIRPGVKEEIRAKYDNDLTIEEVPI